MNRIIKFRAWVESPVQEEVGMYYPTCLQLLGDGEVDKLWTNDFKFSSDVNKFTLMQFTGLKDKNGVEIYEGDIVKNKDGTIEQVYYSDEYAQFVKGKKYMGVFDNIHEDAPYCEVIGNIYENKELLEDRK